MKKAQVTIFIILGIIILVVLSLLIVLVSKTIIIGGAQSIEEKKQELQEYLQSCLKETAEQAIYLIGSGGGYINPLGSYKHGEPGDGIPAEAHMFIETGMLPYVLTSTNIILRSKEELENTISKYVVAELNNCLNTTRFEQQGFIVKKPNIDFESINFDFSKALIPHSSKPVTVNAIIRDNDVFIKAIYPLLIERSGQRILVEEAFTTIPVRLGLVYNKVKQLLENALPVQIYDVSSNCAKYSSEDKLLNIYVYGDKLLKRYGMRFVDAQPLERGQMPFAFQFAVKNKNIGGWCVG
ncbi:hypothetical protein HYV79_03585 [Candidatus Woesearchaeota archaeon]|nr:hypothetical protein [Candidatus Woesearchaeota archaeon]